MTRLLLALLAVGVAFAADYRAGVARVELTPEGPIWMSGYASRDKPSEGIRQQLWAKALALEDTKGGRLVIVTTDLIGLPRVISDEVAARVAKAYGVDRAQLVLNASHTHTGPLVWPNLKVMLDISGEDEAALRRYARRVVGALVDAIGMALGRMEPAELAFSEGSADFAANRRIVTREGVKFGVNRDGPVDHAVPVIRVNGATISWI